MTPVGWGPWVAPCPVRAARTTIQGKVQRHRKSRVYARTRERLPVLPVLVRLAARQHADASGHRRKLPRGTPPGDIIAAAGTGPTPAPKTSPAAVSVWACDPATGKRRNLTAEEDRAFWAWDAVEVLRATGIRVEELVVAQPSQFRAEPAARSPASWCRCCRSSRPRPTSNGCW